MKELLKGILASAGYALRKLPQGPPSPIRLWDDDPEFNELYKAAAPFTLVDKERCFVLYQLAKQARSVDGEVIEVGVYKGGTANLLGNLFLKSGKPIHLFDTFSGMPAVDAAKDLHKEGDFSDADLARVKDYLSGFKNMNFRPGLFPATAGPIQGARFCFAHIDVDIHKSVQDCCDFIYPRMNAGGVMVFDDYGFLTCPGAKDAVDGFFRDKKESVVYLATGQACIFKL